MKPKLKPKKGEKNGEPKLPWKKGKREQLWTRITSRTRKLRARTTLAERRSGTCAESAEVARAALSDVRAPVRLAPPPRIAETLDVALCVKLEAALSPDVP